MFSSILLTMVAFGAMIFIHELGHFLAAKRVGVRVEKFYLGFDFWGFKLFKFVHKGTEYGIGVFPLGGYVKMAGQEDFGKANIDGKPDEFTSKTVGERAQILVAGVLFNFVSAFLFSALALYMGYRLVAPEIGGVEVGSPAWTAGLKAGDRVVSYDGFPITSFDSLGTEVALGGAGRPLKMTVKRDGKEFSLDIKAEMSTAEIPSLGLEPAQSMQVLGIADDSAAFMAGIQPGDRILSLQGETITSWNELSPKINDLVKSGQKELTLVLDREGNKVEVVLKPQMQKAPMLGFRPSLGRQIQAVLPGSILADAGVEAGMTLLSVNGTTVHDVLAIEADELVPSRPLSLIFGGLDQTLSVDFEGTWEDMSEILLFGHVASLKKVIVSRIEKNSTAEEMGLLAGDEIVSFKMEGEAAVLQPDWQTLYRNISTALNKNVQLDVKRNGQLVSLKALVSERETGRYIIGMMPDYVMAPNHMSVALMMPFQMLRQTYKGMLSLVTGKVPLKHMSGPVGILKVTYMMASAGLGYLFYLMALLSINLAFLNSLPIPVLDGGHLLFCLVEWIKGSPLSESVLEKVQFVGLALLLSLFLFATWNDITQQILS